MTKCLLRNINEDLCSPMSPVYIGLHGHNGRGGRAANAGIPKDYEGVLLADSPARENQAQIYRMLDAYVKSFNKQFKDVQDELYAQGQTDDEVRIKSLYLWSRSPGTGKTTTAAALLNEYLLRNYIGTLKRKQTPSQRPAYFLDVNNLQTIYNEFNRPRVPDNIGQKAAERYYSAIEKAKHTEYAVLDDIGVRDVSDGFRGDLHSIINYRVTNRMATVYTSNLPLSELPHVFNEARLADRIGDMTQTIHFEGKSMRGKR